MSIEELGTEPQNAREVMLKDEWALELTEHFVVKALEDIGEPQLSAVVVGPYTTAMQRALSRAESPIERMLFGWLVLHCAGRLDGLVVLDPPADADLGKLAAERRKAQQAVASVVKAATRTNGRTVDEYIDWLESTGEICADEALYWRGQWLGYQLKLNDAFHVVPNAPLPKHGADGRNIRVDAWIFIPARPSFSVIVECDGFEWHGTKGAFTDDRQRDRALRAKGATVLRYSGAEIHRDPMETANDLYEQLATLRKSARKHLPPLNLQSPA